MPKEKKKASKEQRMAIREARMKIEEAYKMDSNEANTRRRVEWIFVSVMGYDAFKHLSQERAVQTAGEAEYVDFTVQLEPGHDVQPIIMVEIKKVGIDLANKHLKQVTSYAIDAGCKWVVLTNGREWKVYHVESGPPPRKPELVSFWNLLNDDIDDLVWKFDLISYKSIKKDALNEHWQRVKVLAPSSLLSAIVTEDTFKAIRRNLHKESGVMVGMDDVFNGIRGILNEAAADAISEFHVPQIGKTAKKARF